MDKFFPFYFIIPISLGTAITLAGAILLAIDSRRKQKVVQAQGPAWETTGGKVVAIHMEKRQPASDQAEALQAPVVDYVYNVEEKEYSGRIIFPESERETNPEAVEEFLERFPMNAYVPVRFNPEDPSISNLDAKQWRSNRIRFIGLLCTYFGISVCCFTSFMAFLILGNIL